MKRSHEEIECRDGELARSNAELEQFAFVAAHDLHAPLRTVAGYLRLLEEDYGDRLGPDGRELLHSAIDGTRRMQRLIDDILTYARAGGRDRPLAMVDVEKALGVALEDLRAHVDAAGAVVTHEPLPAVYGDGAHVGQLLHNLLANALTFRGQAPPRVHVWAERDGEFWRFAVRDNGIGIAPEHAGVIFDAFRRLHGPDDYPGTGIGLALCKKIVERHGGRIWAESAPGEGATFYFTLPALPEERPAL